MYEQLSEGCNNKSQIVANLQASYDVILYMLCMDGIISYNNNCLQDATVKFCLLQISQRTSIRNNISLCMYIIMFIILKLNIYILVSQLSWPIGKQNFPVRVARHAI